MRNTIQNITSTPNTKELMLGKKDSTQRATTNSMYSVMLPSSDKKDNYLQEVIKITKWTRFMPMTNCKNASKITFWSRSKSTVWWTGPNRCFKYFKYKICYLVTPLPFHRFQKFSSDTSGTELTTGPLSIESLVKKSAFINMMRSFCNFILYYKFQIFQT